MNDPLQPPAEEDQQTTKAEEQIIDPFATDDSSSEHSVVDPWAPENKEQKNSEDLYATPQFHSDYQPLDSTFQLDQLNPRQVRKHYIASISVAVIAFFYLVLSFVLIIYIVDQLYSFIDLLSYAAIPLILTVLPAIGLYSRTSWARYLAMTVMGFTTLISIYLLLYLSIFNGVEYILTVLIFNVLGIYFLSFYPALFGDDRVKHSQLKMRLREIKNSPKVEQ